jgi:hypothetical protein
MSGQAKELLADKRAPSAYLGGKKEGQRSALHQSVIPQRPLWIGCAGDREKINPNVRVKRKEDTLCRKKFY